MSADPLFQRFVHDELALAPALVDKVVAGTTQLLGQSRDPGIAASERAAYGDIVRALQRDGTLYRQAFVESLRNRVADELLTPDDATGSQAGGGALTLELMDESRVDVDIEISRAMQLIDSTAEWELRELQTYTSTLTGHRHVAADSNPFRPLVYASALWDAACAVVGSQVQRTVLLRTSAGVAAGLLKNAWAAASTRLEGSGVQPGAYRTVVLPSGASFGRFPGKAEVELARTGALSALLARMPSVPEAGTRTAPLPGSPDAARGEAGLPGVRSDGTRRQSAELEQALLRLDELLRHLPAETSLTGRSVATPRLEAHRAALVASASEPIDRQVIELVTRLFESLLADSQVPTGFRPVLARLQIPALRVALADPSTLDADDHPIWRLIDRIGETSIGYSRSEDPRLVAFQHFAAAVAEEMAGASTPDTTLFRRGLNRIDVFLSEQLQAALRGAHAAIDQLQLAERREILEQHLSQRLADQMASVRASPGIRRFVTGTWARVIAEDMLRTGEQSEQTLADLKTVDDLLWSLKIPDHPQSRQRLLHLLPTLLQRVRVGMELVNLPLAEQQQVLDELMVIHTEALRPGSRQPGGALSPEEIVQRMREEVVTDAPPPRAFSDSVIDLSSMETVPAEHLPSTGGLHDGEDDPARRVERLRAGERQRVFLHGRWARVQLLWRSDRGMFFLFSGDSPTRSHSITRRALERLASAGLVQPIESKPLMRRATERMLRELSSRSAAAPVAPAPPH